MTNEETITEENIDENAAEDIVDGSSNDTSENNIEETLKKRLELELGLPLTPQLKKHVEQSFDDRIILVENFPILEIKTLRVDGNVLTDEDYVLNESEGCIYLNNNHEGFLYLEYCYGLPEYEYKPLLDLMIEYENDHSWDKNASSIKENNVTVSYDTSVGKGALIQGMIQELRNRYHCVVEMV